MYIYLKLKIKFGFIASLKSDLSAFNLIDFIFY